MESSEEEKKITLIITDIESSIEAINKQLIEWKSRHVNFYTKAEEIHLKYLKKIKKEAENLTDKIKNHIRTFA